MGQEFDLVLQRQRARRPSGGVFGTASAVAAAQVAAASGVDAEAAIKREPPSTPELDTIMDWLTSVNGAAAVPSPSTAAIKHLLLPIPGPAQAGAGACNATPGLAARSGTAGCSSLGTEPSLRDAFRTPDMPMLGLALFSPHTQSQLDFGSLGGDLLLEVGNDPLGLLSPLQPRQQASQFAHRPSSGVSSVKPAAQPGSSTAAGAAAVPARLASAAHSSQAHTVSSMQRHIDAGEISFLRSPRSVPALFKSPEEQHAVGMQQRQQQQRQWRQQQQHQHQQRQQYQPRRPSLFSPGSAFSPAYQTPLADLAAHSMAVSTAPAPQQAPEVQGRNLVLVDTAELASADSYVQQLLTTGMEVATFTGSVPGLAVERAVPAVREAAAALRQRLLEVVAELCASIRTDRKSVV